MRSLRLIYIVDCHAEGEIGYVITGGVAQPRSTRFIEKSCFQKQYDGLEYFILNMPRGGVFSNINLFVSLITQQSDYQYSENYV